METGDADGRGAAKRARAARKQAGLTQLTLAKRLKCSQAFVSQAETGAAQNGEHYVRRVLAECGLAPEWGAPPTVTVTETPREGWDLLPDEIAGLDPETFVPVRKDSERDLELCGQGSKALHNELMTCLCSECVMVCGEPCLGKGAPTAECSQCKIKAEFGKCAGPFDACVMDL